MRRYAAVVASICLFLTYYILTRVGLKPTAPPKDGFADVGLKLFPQTRLLASLGIAGARAGSYYKRDINNLEASPQ